LGRGKPSPYGLQLREKQRAKRIYGVLESQFRRTFQMASRRKGMTGTVMLQLLETRLDNVVYRLGLASSRPAARQMIRHGKVLIDGHKTDIPSCQVKVGQTIAAKPNYKEHDAVKRALELAKKNPPLTWLQYDAEVGLGRLISMPRRDEIPIELNEQAIVELYSK
jgi:small subunit ribosomal protein S4